MSHARAIFSRLVAAWNGRDGYELELADAACPVSLERRTVLSRRLAGLAHEIQSYEAELARTEQRLRTFEAAA
jgi:hypothetical protein